MKVGDLIRIGWSGVWKQPFVAVIRKVHCFRKQGIVKNGEISGYTVYIPATGKETFITPRDVMVLNTSNMS